MKQLLRTCMYLIIPVLLSAKHVEIGIIADPQWGDGTILKDFPSYPHASNLNYQFSTINQELENTLREYSEKEVDFVITLGDLIEHHFDQGPSDWINTPTSSWSSTPYSDIYLSHINNSNRPNDTQDNLEDIIDLYYNSRFTPSLSDELSRGRNDKYLYFVVGNHDVNTRTGESNPIEEFHIDDITGDSNIGYYSFTRNGYRFIVLNTTSTNARNRVDATQISWLRRELTDAQNNNEEVLIFGHHALGKIYPGSTGSNVINSSDVLDVINDFNHVIAYMSGHTHAPLRWVKDDGVYYINYDALINNRNPRYIINITDHKIIINANGNNSEELILPRTKMNINFSIY